jgi:hypothetical protein
VRLIDIAVSIGSIVCRQNDIHKFKAFVIRHEERMEQWGKRTLSLSSLKLHKFCGVLFRSVAGMNIASL